MEASDGEFVEPMEEAMPRLANEYSHRKINLGFPQLENVEVKLHAAKIGILLLKKFTSS